MRFAVFIFLFLMLVSSIYGFQNDEYIIVVDEDGPVTDVLEGTNFALWISASEPVPGFPLVGGVRFTSATDQQIYDQLTDEDVEDKLLLVIDSEKKTILGLTGETAPAERIRVAASAAHYFAERGYIMFMHLIGEPVFGTATVWNSQVGDRTMLVNLEDGSYAYDGFKFEKGHIITLEDIFLGDALVESSAEHENEAEEPDEVDDIAEHMPSESEETPEAEEETKEEIPETIQPELKEHDAVEPAEKEDEHNIFVRIFRWLKGFFSN